jgi:hypothetical protein
MCRASVRGLCESLLGRHLVSQEHADDKILDVSMFKVALALPTDQAKTLAHKITRDQEDSRRFRGQTNRNRWKTGALHLPKSLLGRY